MRKFPVLVAIALSGVAVADQVNKDADCNTNCPEGTRLAEFDITEFAQAETENGAFLFVTETCESFCEPITPCVLPNVPVVDSSGFRCELLVGLSDFEPVDDLDLSWGLDWDPVAAEYAPGTTP